MCAHLLLQAKVEGVLRISLQHHMRSNGPDHPNTINNMSLLVACLVLQVSAGCSQAGKQARQSAKPPIFAGQEGRG
jgi:hypothetical protein